MEPQPFLVIVLTILNELLESSDSEDDELDIFLTVKYILQKPQMKKSSVNNYLKNVVRLYSNQEFKNHFRMTRATFNVLLELIASEVISQKRDTIGRGQDTVSVEKQLVLAIWLFATPDSYRFDVGRATAVQAARRVIKALSKVRSRLIKWPEQDEIENIN